MTAHQRVDAVSANPHAVTADLRPDVEARRADGSSRRSTSTLRCRILTDPSEWASLEPHWSRLLEASPDPTPWQSLAWLSPWWRRVSGKRQARVVVVYRAGTPCLVLPLQLARESLPRIRLLEPIGMPDDINRPLLAIGPRDAEALDAALQALWARRAEWDAIRIDEKEPRDWEVAALTEFGARHGLSTRVVSLHPCPRLDLRQTWPAFLSSRGRNLRANLRAARRRLESHGSVRLICAETPNEIETAFETFLEVQSRSWKHAERIGLSQSAAYRECYRSFVMAMAREGRARILVLYAGERPAAATIAVTTGDVYHSAQIAHDRALDKASPGTLLEALELERLMEERRFSTYDFLGAALNNKRRWADDLRPTNRALLLRHSARGRVFDALYFRLKPRLRRGSR